MNYCTFYPLSSALPTLPPKEEAKKYVILSVSEISHDLSEIVYALFKFQAVAGEIVQVRRGGAVVFGLPVNFFGRVSYYKFAFRPR